VSSCKVFFDLVGIHKKHLYGFGNLVGENKNPVRVLNFIRVYFME